ncbi:MAG: hypothetical protein ABJD11_02650 [Gemmatimonadota bacterium]
MPLPGEPLGIVINNGIPAGKSTVIWAYMWADDHDGDDEWHQVVPRERAA